MKLFFKAGTNYLAIDINNKKYRWSRNSAWRRYMTIKVADAKVIIEELELNGFERIDKIIWNKY